MPLDDMDFLPRYPDKEFDLLEATERDLSLSADGCYVLLQRKNWGFRYPYKNSRVFYIGQAGVDSRRLRDHRRKTKKAKQELSEWGCFETYWHPRYCYAAKYGARVLWFSIRGTQLCEVLEVELIDVFYRYYGSIPIANLQWPGQLKGTLI